MFCRSKKKLLFNLEQPRKDSNLKQFEKDFYRFSNVQLRQYFPFRINYTKYLISCRSLINNGFGFIFTGSLKQTKQNIAMLCFSFFEKN